MLAATLISEYEPVVHGWTMKSLAFFGVALPLRAQRRRIARAVRRFAGGLLQRDHWACASAEGIYGEEVGRAFPRRVGLKMQVPVLAEG